ncbi:MAG: tetratricopeptide repeat protein [Thermoguttaceae bacterium]
MIRPVNILTVLLLGLFMTMTIGALRPKSAAEIYEDGKTYLSMGEYDSAIAAFDRAIQLDPRLASAYGSRGKANRLRGEYDRAIADCSRAIQLEPKGIEAYWDRGHCFESKREYKAACQDYCEAMRIDLEMTSVYDEHIVVPRAKRGPVADTSKGL